MNTCLLYSFVQLDVPCRTGPFSFYDVWKYWFVWQPPTLLLVLVRFCVKKEQQEKRNIVKAIKAYTLGANLYGRNVSKSRGWISCKWNSCSLPFFFIFHFDSFSVYKHLVFGIWNDFIINTGVENFLNNLYNGYRWFSCYWFFSDVSSIYVRI